MRVAVIGTGPAGWATTNKLASMGHKVTVFTTDIDANHASFDDQKLSENLKGAKLLHGSSYPYRDFPQGPLKFQSEVNLYSSFAFSGLSLVWGATMLPYADCDLKDWPISTKDLDSGYRFILGYIPVSGRFDALTKLYDPYFNQNPIYPSKRISKFLELMESEINDRVCVGSSRLAVQTTSSDKMGCNYCGQCLTGCPSKFIWFAPEIKSELVEYKRNLRVVSISEMDGKVSLDTVDYHGTSSTFLEFDKVFIGAGNIETFRILANSNLVPLEAINKDSATFFVPFLLSGKYRNPERHTNTLSQAFLRFVGKNTDVLHLQIYDYSDALISRVQRVLPFGMCIPEVILKFVLKRFFVGIGYLESKNSSEIKMSLDAAGNIHLTKSGRNTRSIMKIVNQLLREFNKPFKNAGLKPLFRFIQFALPGEGVHSGGWLKMGDACDSLGRPKGTINVHIVDSSTFPTIPAGAITFTVMANAVRIAEGAIP